MWFLGGAEPFVFKAAIINDQHPPSGPSPRLMRLNKRTVAVPAWAPQSCRWKTGALPAAVHLPTSPRRDTAATPGTAQGANVPFVRKSTNVPLSQEQKQSKLLNIILRNNYSLKTQLILETNHRREPDLRKHAKLRDFSMPPIGSRPHPAHHDGTPVVIRAGREPMRFLEAHGDARAAFR